MQPMRELHCHLYGCLDAEMLWQIGRDRYRTHRDRLAWYEQEYAQAFGRKPVASEYWRHDNGIDLLRKDFEVLEKLSFAQFQACFNLIIALCPIKPDDLMVPKLIFDQSTEKMPNTQMELRSVIPDHLSDSEAHQYLNALYQLLQDYQHPTLREPQFLVAISLPRTPITATISYRRLRDFLVRTPKANRYFAAVDFCFFEENDPPHQKTSFIEQIARDNKETGTHLSVLLHVGETFETVSLAGSARRVLEASLIGIPRLGHATSLGIHPQHLKGRTVIQSADEARYHQQWLAHNQKRLRQFGYTPFKRESGQRKAPQQAATSITYNDDTIADTYAFQKALIRWMASLNHSVIECCPTSNLRLSPISSLQQHPLQRFKEAGLNLVVASDDPGIFASTLSEEVQKCMAAGIASEEDFRAFEVTAERFSSLRLQQ